MACFESGTVITLSPREAITLPDVQGATLRVTRGTLWLTQERDPKDGAPATPIRDGSSFRRFRCGDPGHLTAAAVLPLRMIF